MWLTGDAVWFGTAGALEKVRLPAAPELSELRDAIVAMGRLTVCSQCAARRDLSAADLLPAVRLAGSATFVEEVLPADATALVY